jgi:hypothetical protein
MIIKIPAMFKSLAGISVYSVFFFGDLGFVGFVTFTFSSVTGTGSGVFATTTDDLVFFGRRTPYDLFIILPLLDFLSPLPITYIF